VYHARYENQKSSSKNLSSSDTQTTCSIARRRFRVSGNMETPPVHISVIKYPEKLLKIETQIARGVRVLAETGLKNIKEKNERGEGVS